MYALQRAQFGSFGQKHTSCCPYRKQVRTPEKRNQEKTQESLIHVRSSPLVGLEGQKFAPWKRSFGTTNVGTHGSYKTRHVHTNTIETNRAHTGTFKTKWCESPKRSCCDKVSRLQSTDHHNNWRLLNIGIFKILHPHPSTRSQWSYIDMYSTSSCISELHESGRFSKVLM